MSAQSRQNCPQWLRFSQAKFSCTGESLFGGGSDVLSGGGPGFPPSLFTVAGIPWICGVEFGADIWSRAGWLLLGITLNGEDGGTSRQHAEPLCAGPWRAARGTVRTVPSHQATMPSHPCSPCFDHSDRIIRAGTPGLSAEQGTMQGKSLYACNRIVMNLENWMWFYFFYQCSSGLSVSSVCPSAMSCVYSFPVCLQASEISRINITGPLKGKNL